MAWWKWSNDQRSDSSPPPPDPGQQGPNQPAPPEHSAEWWRFDDPELSERGPDGGPAPISAWMRPGDDPNGQPPVDQLGAPQAGGPNPAAEPYASQPPAEFAGQPSYANNGPMPGAVDAEQYDSVAGSQYDSSGQFAQADPYASDYPAVGEETSADFNTELAETLPPVPDADDTVAAVDTDTANDLTGAGDAPGDGDTVEPSTTESTTTEPSTTQPSDFAPAESDLESSPSGGLSDDSPAATPDNPSTTAPDALVTTPPTKAPTKDGSMADYQTSLNECMQIEGALGVALVETNSGMALATAGNPPTIDLNVAAAGNSTVVQAKLRTMRELGLTDKIEDILITLDTQYHIVRPLGVEDGVFIYLVLDKERGNLAMARFRLAKIERDFSF